MVVVAGDAKSAHDTTTELGRAWDWEAFRNFWQRAGGWYSSGQDAFYLKSSSWEGPRSGRYHWGRYVVLHEYIHALQFQLMGANYIDLNWLLEGSANWYDSDLSTQDRNGYPLSRKLIDALNQASKGPPLEEIESSNETWQYSFGLVAADMLVERAGKSAALDFYRVLAPGRAGPDGRWETRPTLRSAFAAAFGLTLEEFYDEFEALMTKRRGSATRRPASNEFALGGTILNSDGTPRVGASLEAREYRDGYPAGWNRRATSSEDGTFEVFVRRRADYRIWIELGDDYQHCQFWWSEDSDEDKPADNEASLIEISGSQPEPSQSRLTPICAAGGSMGRCPARTICRLPALKSAPKPKTARPRSEPSSTARSHSSRPSPAPTNFPQTWADAVSIGTRMIRPGPRNRPGRSTWSTGMSQISNSGPKWIRASG